LGADEVLLEVRCCGVGNWDEIARNGAWDLGRQPPMALGVEAAGIVAGTGTAVRGLAAGDRVMTHSLPLRAQGAWAERFVAAAAHVALVPGSVPFEVAAALPVPALTAAQALGGGPGVRPGVTVLVSGAGGVTGMLLVQLASHVWRRPRFPLEQAAQALARVRLGANGQAVVLQPGLSGSPGR
jgi:NADPH:quinone reductase-like Zn-dependent oxidoreductase